MGMPGTLELTAKLVVIRGEPWKSHFGLPITIIGDAVFRQH